MTIRQWITLNYNKYSDTEKSTLIDDCVKACNAKHESVARTLRKFKKTKLIISDSQGENPVSNQNVSEIQCEKSFGKDDGFIETKSPFIKTEEDAIKYAEVDLDYWEKSNCKINFWGSMSNPDNRCWQVKVFFTKRKQSYIVDAIKEYIETTVKPKKYVPYTYTKHKDNLLELCLFDLHLGMLAWSHEAEKSYDLNIARSIYLNSIERLLCETSHFDYEKIVIPLGQDFFHIDDQTNSTPENKNALDVDGRLAKVFLTGLHACEAAIQRCAEVAPVEVKYVPGNHDPRTSFYLCVALNRAFANYKHIDIDISPKHRKYIKYGISLIGYTHGVNEKIQDLPRIMNDECNSIISGVKFKEWRIGHTHTSKKLSFISTESFGSTTVRAIPSLSSGDVWHYKKGYVGHHSAAEAYITNKKEGPKGYVPVYVK